MPNSKLPTFSKFATKDSAMEEIMVQGIKEIAKLVKNLKIVSINIYKFRKLEEKLYNELGIAIQFSNSFHHQN